jgi:hypothetical protein
MENLIIDHGVSALTSILLVIGIVLSRWAFPLVKNAWANGVLHRAWIEVQTAVLDVAQTYTDALKEHNADGKLTTDEKAEAQLRAKNKAKELIGKKGLAALARIVGVDVEKWLTGKVEAAVKISKPIKAAGAAPLGPQ